MKETPSGAPCLCDPSDVRASAEWTVWLQWLLGLGSRLRECLEIVQAIGAAQSWRDSWTHLKRLGDLFVDTLPTLPDPSAVRNSGAENVAALAAKLPTVQESVAAASGFDIGTLLKLLPMLRELLPLLRAIFDRFKNPSDASGYWPTSKGGGYPPPAA